MGFVLIVMFTMWPSSAMAPFVAMQRFETEEACLAAQKFIIGQHPGQKTKCIKDVKDDGTKPQQ
jgi:hypothetical protein